MAITQNAGGTMVTGEDIDVLRFMMGLRAVAMEVATGMKPTRGFSALAFAAEYGVKARTKKAALEGLVEVMKKADPEWEPKGTVARALAL